MVWASPLFVLPLHKGGNAKRHTIWRKGQSHSERLRVSNLYLDWSDYKQISYILPKIFRKIKCLAMHINPTPTRTDVPDKYISDIYPV